jgi:L-ornithine N5-oxygenase
MTRFRAEPYDLVGIGFGPANIGLAVALEESGWRGSVLFFERRNGPDWQPGMLLDGTDIQHNPLRDFVTPRNPLSPYSFLHFLKLHGRLFQFLNLDTAYPLRKDYAEYIRWVAGRFDRWVSYDSEVSDITLDKPGAQNEQLATIHLAGGDAVKARAVSVAPGRTPAIPALFAPLLGDRIVHFTDYLQSRARWESEGSVKSVCVVGGSQSAIEITLDLAKRHPPVQIHNLQRGFGYQLKDTSPFTEEIYFPDFVDTFYQSSDQRKGQLWQELRRSNYGSADHDVIQQLYCQLYEQRLDGSTQISLHTTCEIIAAERKPNGPVVLTLRDLARRGVFELCVDAVILATGFRNFGLRENEEQYPPLLKRIAPSLLTSAGALSVSRDYRILAANSDRHMLPIFLNGLCESSHGFGDAGSFSLLSLRSQTIAESVMQALKMDGWTSHLDLIERNGGGGIFEEDIAHA